MGKPLGLLLVALALLAAGLTLDRASAPRPLLISDVGAAATPAPAPAAAAAVTPPIDPAMRAKFPGTRGEYVDALAYVNRLVNAAIQGVEDKAHYGVDELWVMFPADGKGDCEDYVLTKLGILSANGFDIVDHARIRTVMAHHRTGSYGHAILELLMPDGAILFMDNRFDDLMTRPELEARGYEFFDW